MVVSFLVKEGSQQEPESIPQGEGCVLRVAVAPSKGSVCAWLISRSALPSLPAHLPSTKDFFFSQWWAIYCFYMLAWCIGCLPPAWEVIVSSDWRELLLQEGPGYLQVGFQHTRESKATKLVKMECVCGGGGQGLLKPRGICHHHPLHLSPLSTTNGFSCRDSKWWLTASCFYK